MTREERFTLAPPGDGGFEWWTIEDLEKMHPVAHFFAKNPLSEAMAKNIYAQLVAGMLSVETVRRKYESWGWDEHES
jgi:hypothetical protein